VAGLGTLRLPDLSAVVARFRLTRRRRERFKLQIAALLKLAADQLRAEWAGSPPHRWLIARPAPQGQAAAPRELRPVRARRTKALLAGRFVFDGLSMECGPGGDPWNRAAPSRAFAVGLHGMDWLPDLLAAQDGPRMALGLVGGWDKVFGGWNSFSWSGPVLERRVHNLACATAALIREADPSEARRLLDSLAAQARHLMLGVGEDARHAEQACAAATAATVLGGPAGDGLLDRALKRLQRELPRTVLPDGGHASRSPEAGMELLLDLRILNDALGQRGRPAPAALTQAVDRLTAALHVFILADGRLPALQGGEEGEPARVQAALAGDPPPAQLDEALPHSGYDRLTGRLLQLFADSSAPATGPFGASACAQPMAIEVLAGGQRLIASAAWSPRAPYAQALRLTPAASTVSVADASCGQPLSGGLAKVLGYRLEGATTDIFRRRHDGEAAAWLELTNEAWAEAFGVIHDRRLYMDRKADELRGEDRLVSAPGPAPASKRPAVLVVRFQLHPEVKASLALDAKSVLLQLRTGPGWWLRNDAPEVSLEPAVRLQEGRPVHTTQIVLRAHAPKGGHARIRWKLGLADK
jgi:uncharacterized heparinase superfamily protein